MVVAHTVLSLHLVSLALGLAIPPTLPDALTNITSNCQSADARSACSTFITDSLNTCHPSDMACVCSQFASIVDFCGTTCAYKPGSLHSSKEFMDQECSKVEWKSPPLKAAGVLDRVLGHTRKHNGDETDNEYEEDEDHSTCNNGDDSDPGTNWRAYGKRSLIEDSAREIALADGSDVNVGDSISLRDRLLIHGTQANEGVHLVVKPEHYQSGISRRDNSESESIDKDEHTTSSEQCDYDDARKQIAQEIVHAADTAFSSAPKKTIEHFLENVLAGISHPRTSRKQPTQITDISEPVDNEVEVNETTNSAEEQDVSYQNDEEELEHDESSVVVSIVYVTESSPSTSHEPQTHSVLPQDLSTITAGSLKSSSTERSTSYSSSSSPTTAAAAVASATTISVITAESSVEKSHSPSSSIHVGTSLHVSSTIVTEFARTSPAVEPPSLTVARAFSLADELALKEEMDAQSTDEQSELEIDGDSELELASSFASKYLAMPSVKVTSSAPSVNGVNSSIPKAKVSAWGTGEDHYRVDHMRGEDGNRSTSNGTSNSTLNSTSFSTSQKGAKSGAVLNSVSALALAIGLFLSITL